MKEPINLNIIDEEFYSTHFSLVNCKFKFQFVKVKVDSKKSLQK